MPQMMPINWLILFFIFIIIYFIFNMMNYYIFIMKMNKNNMKIFYKKKINWKW